MELQDVFTPIAILGWMILVLDIFRQMLGNAMKIFSEICLVVGMADALLLRSVGAEIWCYGPYFILSISHGIILFTGRNIINPLIK